MNLIPHSMHGITVELGDGHTDVVQFTAEMLAPIFGSPPAGLAMLARLTGVFRQWRERVEWCPVCHRYVPIHPAANRNQASRHATRLLEHSSVRGRGKKCSGSKRNTVWCGADSFPDLSEAAVRLFAGGDDATCTRSPK